MIMKKFVLVISCIITLPAFAQQDPLYSLYMLNPLLISPAYAGLNNNLNGMVGYRAQWTGYEGNPETLTLSAHSSLIDNRVGAGVLFINDKVGNISNTELSFSAAYKLLLKDKVFSFGMQAGIQNYQTDNSELNIFDPGDNAFIGGERGTRINMGAGAILKSEKYFFGFSVPRLLPSTFTNGAQEFTLYNRHYYLVGAYVFRVNDRIRLKPSALLRGVNKAPASVDLGFNINLNAVHTAGIFTRNLSTYGVLLQTIVKEQLRLGYVFELPTANSVGAQFATHEVSIGVILPMLPSHQRSLSNF